MFVCFYVFSCVFFVSLCGWVNGLVGWFACVVGRGGGGCEGKEGFLLSGWERLCVFVCAVQPHSPQMYPLSLPPSPPLPPKPVSIVLPVI